MGMMGAMIKKAAGPVPNEGESPPSDLTKKDASKQEARAAGTEQAAAAKNATDKSTPRKGALAREDKTRQATWEKWGLEWAVAWVEWAAVSWLKRPKS